jgi:serine/threonine protein kinase
MGEVWRAYDTKLRREAAIKTVLLLSPETRDRFLREARAMGEVKHPNVIGIYELSSELAKVPYFAMDLLKQ